MNPKTLLERYNIFETRYGADAPVAMLRWLRMAVLSDDIQCRALARVIERLLVKRCIAVFEAANSDDDLTEIEAYQTAATETRRFIAKAVFMATMAHGIGEV